MWGIDQLRKRVRHFWGAGGNGQLVSLCGLQAEGSLDYAHPVRFKKCLKCTEEMGRKKKEVTNVVQPITPTA